MMAYLMSFQTAQDEILVELAATNPIWLDYVAALGPAAILIAALVAAGIGWANIRDRSAADQKSDWWNKAHWAIDHATSEDRYRKELGLGILERLAQSDLTGSDEAAILEIAWESVLPVRLPVEQ